ncbi:ribosomal protein S18 acetylase RimI-like enzyme [Actinoalloteichus hoggarensis]|uniref:Acetyltransferase (GNAT) family protein n=2 Tax=Actinoalloteichus hoggarensis TaxID=1470176 RepID=A0A221W8S8_9PSEU|nr:Acetyltransferase (GNAT) family protein [Actinoalloteichus hoggarensis]MBB5923774.1 ribosomal protein S18 acetylase RimI-like enzyme [Actinoalloteichus hoggarensis]
MSAAAAAGGDRFVELSAEDMRTRLTEALHIYVTAMRYPPSAMHHRGPTWLSHASREGWRGVAALDHRGGMVGVAYGYRGAPGQWWYEQVNHGLLETGDAAGARHWLRDYFELTELHVLPKAQGHGIGEGLLRMLLADAEGADVLLSTPEGPSRAWRLYRRVGFKDVLRDYRFAGDSRPFAVLGRTLPLD